MQVTIVHVSVMAEYVDAFKRACQLNHEASIKEVGNFRFDVLQAKGDPTQFVIYEAYDSVISAALHKDTRHYIQWRDTVAPWMASPRLGVSYDGIFPARVED